MQRVRRVVFIVAPGQRKLFESLSRTFAGDETVHVLLDRRGGERRQRPKTTSMDRRQKDRRRNVDIQKQLARRGYAVVGIVVAKAPARRS